VPEELRKLVLEVKVTSQGCHLLLYNDGPSEEEFCDILVIIELRCCRIKSMAMLGT
jgi:hypothetical protein